MFRKYMQSLKISHKLTFGFAFIVILSLVNGILAYNALDTVSKLTQTFYDHPFTVSVTAERARVNITAMQRSMKDVLLAEDATQLQEVSKQVDVYEQRVYDHLAVVHERFLGDKQLVEIVEDKFREWKPIRDQVIALSAAGNKEEAEAIVAEKGAKQVEEIMTVIEELTVFARSTAENFTVDANKQSRNAMITMVIVVIISLVFSVIIAVIIMRGITRSLNTIKKEIDDLTERGGDLTQEIKLEANDEIGAMGRSINRFIAGLRDIIANVKNNSENVASASQEIAAASEEIASASNEQAVSTQTMNELFKELVESIQAVASSAEAAASLSSNTAQVAEDGGNVIHSSIEGMNQVSQHIAKLEEDSKQIGNIIEVIDEIADQTNLLALNAAIEAARAGEQGRGFAVVADEVRKLAERSGEATKQITQIITAMQSNTEDSVQAVNEGMAKSQETHEAFTKIVSMVVDVSQKVSEIAAASEEQSAQSNEVIQSIEAIAAASEESAASAEQSSAAAQSLAQLAEELLATVENFKV